MNLSNKLIKFEAKSEIESLTAKCLSLLIMVTSQLKVFKYSFRHQKHKLTSRS